MNQDGTVTAQTPIAKFVMIAFGLAILAVSYTILAGSDSTHSLPDDALPLNSANRAPVSEQKCVACHEDQVDRFENAPHHNTLLPGNHPAVRQRLAGKTFVDEAVDAEFRYVQRDDYVWLESNRRSKPLRVDWLFGSGHHASTPVTVVESPDGGSTVLQQAVSWYPDDIVAWTLGRSPELRDLPGIQGVASPHTAQESRECFLCHTTWLPEDNDRLDLARAVPNVTCTRCHTQAEQHVADPQHGSIQNWASLTPLESVNRCGECHRRADHFTADELVTSNKLLVRFASASLVQSGCFKAQSPEKRLDCMTCHDPHEPASSDPGYYNQRCVSCHSGVPDAQCKSSATTDKCISCHMVTEQVQDGLDFTDHWIRVR